MPAQNYRNSAIRREVYQKIEDLVHPNKRVARSVASFIEEAVKEKLERMNQSTVSVESGELN
jgi:hypothetical protein